MSIARAIQHLDRYAQKDLRALTARVLEPALRALPEAFENDSEDALALREASVSYTHLTLPTIYSV